MSATSKNRDGSIYFGVFSLVSLSKSSPILEIVAVPSGCVSNGGTFFVLVEAVPVEAVSVEVDREPNFRNLFFFSRGGRRNFTRCPKNTKVVYFKSIFECESVHVHQRHQSTSRPDSRISSHLPGVL